MAKSARWTTDSFLHPVPALSGQWLKDCDDGSAEFRLAASLASVWGRYGQEKGKARVLSIRQHLEPVATWKGSAGLVVRWDWEADADVVWSPGHIVDAMNAVLQRRLMRAVQAGMEVYPDIGRVAADLGDIADFINGAVDEQRLIELFWGCLLLDWTRTSAQQRPSRRSADAEPVGALYALLKLCFSGVASRSAAGSESETTAQSSNGETPKGDSAAGSPRLAQLAEVRLEPRLHRAAASGEGARAATEASRRLRASGLSPALQRAYASPALARRTAAALLFPVNAATKRRLAALVLREPSQTPSQENLTAKEGIHP